MNENKWIKVTERLPKPYQAVWIYWRDKEVLVGYRTHNDQEAALEPEHGWYSVEDEKCRWSHYWMPLDKPKPPTEYEP